MGSTHKAPKPGETCPLCEEIKPRPFDPVPLISALIALIIIAGTLYGLTN